MGDIIDLEMRRWEKTLQQDENGAIHASPRIQRENTRRMLDEFNRRHNDDNNKPDPPEAA